MSADKKRFIEGKLSSALHALKYRNFKFFLGGQLVSLIGNYIQTVAQAWLVYRLTGSAALLGLVAFSGQISIFVLAPISGVVADTKSKRGILFVTQIAPMVLTFILALLTLTARVQVWHVFMIAALLGVINAFDFPVRQAFVAELVTKEDLMSAVTLNSSMINSARTIGPGIGGLLVASVGEGWCFLGNALSYVAVIIGLMMIKSDASPKKPARHLRASVAEAFNFARHTGPVGGLLVASVGEGWCFLGNALSYIAVIIGLMMMKTEASPHKPARHLRAGAVGLSTSRGIRDQSAPYSSC